MLVLSRNRNEVIVIDTGREVIEVMVVEVRNGNRVQLGITAPKHVRIDRAEIRELRKQKGQA